MAARRYGCDQVSADLFPWGGGHFSTTVAVRPGMEIRAWRSGADGTVVVNIGGAGGFHEISLSPEQWDGLIGAVRNITEETPA